jgi:stage V sporulation protein G
MIPPERANDMFAVTDVRIKLMQPTSGKLLAFCTFALDHCFVVKDVKVITTDRGTIVAMPARKISSHCVRCSGRNHLKARWCNDCGQKLDESKWAGGLGDAGQFFSDCVHPITRECRALITRSVLAAYDEELERSKEAGYVCRFDDWEARHESDR